MPMSINRCSKNAVAVIQREASDPAYHSLLLSDPQAALAGLGLNAAELTALSNLDAAALDALVAEVRG